MKTLILSLALVPMAHAGVIKEAAKGVAGITVAAAKEMAFAGKVVGKAVAKGTVKTAKVIVKL
jgi:hypothetical protein